MTRGQQEPGALELASGGGDASFPGDPGGFGSILFSQGPAPIRERSGGRLAWLAGGLWPHPRGLHRQEAVIPGAMGWAVGPLVAVSTLLAPSLPSWSEDLKTVPRSSGVWRLKAPFP